MMPAVIRRLPLTVWLLGAAALASGCGTSSLPAVTYAQYTVTCCQSGDINRLYHPGDALVVHWIVSPSTRTASDVVTTLTLSVTLEGAYASVPALKSGPPAPLGNGAPPAYTLRAVTVTTTDRSITAPTSVIQLPADLPTGYYDLVTAVTAPDSITSGGGVIQVTG
jgi:hypothetical protein